MNSPPREKSRFSSWNISPDEEDAAALPSTLKSWRCHLSGTGGFQWGCYLRKERVDGDMKFYSMEGRKECFLEELERIEGLEI